LEKTTTGHNAGRGDRKRTVKDSKKGKASVEVLASWRGKNLGQGKGKGGPWIAARTVNQRGGLEFTHPARSRLL